MSRLKALAGQTVVYGLSSIAGKMINFLLYPFFSWVFSTSQFAIVGLLYAYSSFVKELYSMGMETTYFYQSAQGEEQKVFNQSFSIILGISLPASLILYLGAPFFESLVYTGNPAIYKMFAFIMLFDSLALIPFARLRFQNKAFRFTFLRLSNILLTVGLNLFFFIACPWLLEHDIAESFISVIYKEDHLVDYVVIANLIASCTTFLLLLPLCKRYRFTMVNVKPYLRYAWPLIIVGLAAMVNETFDKILLEWLLPLPFNEARSEIGIYAQVYKLSILMSLAIQAFKFAAEPFFFSINKNHDAKETYAEVLRWFVITQCVILMLVWLNLDVIVLIIDPKYRVGKSVVPILLMANLCLGIYYNLSIWYKALNKTTWGAMMSVAGAVITLALNFLLIPIMGYAGAAWATLACYGSMMLMSFAAGNRFYPVAYPYGRLIFYVSVATVLCLAFTQIEFSWPVWQVASSLVVIGIFAVLVLWLEKPKKLLLLRSKAAKWSK